MVSHSYRSQSGTRVPNLNTGRRASGCRAVMYPDCPKTESEALTSPQTTPSSDSEVMSSHE